MELSFSAILGQAILGWIIADFLGGLVHWWEDRVGWPTNHWIDRHVLDPNRLHHTDPVAFTKAPFFMRNWTTFATVLAIGAVWVSIFGLSVVVLFAVICGLITNEVHYYQHAPSRGWIRTLQETGVIQSRAQHNKHHTPPFNSHYCILTGWLNPILERIGFWTFMERILRVKPRMEQEDNPND